MSAATTKTPAEVNELVQTDGYVYVDVRSEAEFQAGHPPGAVNVPVSSAGVPNPDFVPVLERAFGKDAKLVVGCKSGPRSRRACDALRNAGFTDVVDMPAGFGGGRDEFGRALSGWVAVGLPVETGAPSGQSYGEVKERSK